ncbi:MAG TPA: cytochrome c biogenesis protein CcdA [Acidimicrobiia bacterium]|nr:cytochrome c biogenesis protein CcdA [Acidimicrobiia bacterium]
MTPILFAFSAGMVATVNPCGFAMLPVYLSMFLTDDEEASGRSGVSTGLRVGLIVTLAFVVTFLIVGSAFQLVSRTVVRYVPWAALAIGVLVIAAGVAVLSGRHLGFRALDLRFGKDRSVKSVASFGVAYALASVSCTLPIFLAVATAATGAATLAQGVAVFTAYGLGMGIVLVALAVAVATSRDALVTRMRRLLPYVERIGGWFLIASGLFIVYYWTTLLTAEITIDNPLLAPILFVDGISAWFTNQIGNNVLGWTVGLVLFVTGLAVYEVLRRRRLASRPATPVSS